MSSPIEKSCSEPNIADAAQSQVTPTTNITIRNKRKREDDFATFKKEMQTMMSTMLQAHLAEIKKNTDMLNDIKQSNLSIEDAVSYLSAKYDESQTKINKLEAEVREDRKYIAMLEYKVLDLERENRKTNFMIKNVPIQKSETKNTLIHMVSSLGESVSCPIKSSDIKDIYRIKNKKENTNNSAIIVETTSTLIRNDILKLSKAFNLKNSENLRAKHLGMVTNPNTPIFISEQLTLRASRLHFLARELKKKGNFKHCWTSYGNVYLRKDDNSEVFLITNEKQIERLAKED
ncbi:uncharacterized protein [Choristoneura fumiferana]|uniref:uncharacterized protein n=1 Tax=Choristoneura fumiferana TaxID=7141 RepID=UPI003D15E0E9